MAEGQADLAYTEEAWTEEMENVEKSQMGMAKKIFILAKTGFVVFQTLKGAWAWRNSKKKMTVPAILCLLFSALIVSLVCAYKFTSKELRPLVTLQAMSHYLCFIILHVLVGYVECKNFDMRDKLLRAFYIFHVIYWGIIWVSWHTTTCTKENFYPDAFMLNNCFSFGIFVMVYMLHSRGYLLEWGDDEKVAKNLFTKQSERYFSFYTFLVEWHLVELAIGKGLDTFTDSIMCGGDGQKWIFSSFKGNLFMMLHIIGTMMGTGMARAVFIKTAKAEGMFGGVDEGDSDNEEDEKTGDKKKPAKVEPKKQR